MLCDTCMNILRMNILHINADDHRADGLKALGNAMLVTPNLDSLAASGMTFTRCYTMGSIVGTVCTPSRTMMLTGRSWLRITGVPGALPNDAGDGVLADGQRELVLETLGAEGGLFAQPDDDAFQSAGGLMRAVLGAAGAFGQGGGFAGDVASQPFANGVARATELAGGGLEAVGAREGDELLMQPMTIGAHTVEFKAGAVHAGRMASLARRCCASSGGTAAPSCGVCSTPGASPQGGSRSTQPFPARRKNWIGQC